MLKRLPQSIENIKNLIILDLSHNKLLYLPATIIRLNLRYLDISMNPFQLQRRVRYRIQVQSLVKLTVNIVLQYRFVISFNFSHTNTNTNTHTHTHTHSSRVYVCTQMFLFTYLLCYTIFCL